MKITKQQLKQIIKEEIEKVLNESLIANIPAGAVVWQSADPMGINFKHTDPDGGEKKYGEIKLWDLEPTIQKSIDKSNEDHLQFMVDQFVKNNDPKIPFTVEDVTYKPGVPYIEESKQLEYIVLLARKGFNITIKQDSQIINEIKNIYDEIQEADLSIGNIPSILLELASRIEELEFRLSQTDGLPYPARESNGELRYDFMGKSKGLQEIKKS